MWHIPLSPRHTDPMKPLHLPLCVHVFLLCALTLRWFANQSPGGWNLFIQILKQTSRTPPPTPPTHLPSPQLQLCVTMPTNIHMKERSNLLIALASRYLWVSWAECTAWTGSTHGVIPNTWETQTCVQTRPQHPAPSRLQRTTVEPGVSVGINRSAQSSSHPA